MISRHLLSPTYLLFVESILIVLSFGHKAEEIPEKRKITRSG